MYFVVTLPYFKLLVCSDRAPSENMFCTSACTCLMYKMQNERQLTPARINWIFGKVYWELISATKTCDAYQLSVLWYTKWHEKVLDAIRLGAK